MMANRNHGIDGGDKSFKVAGYWLKIISTNVFTLGSVAVAIFAITHGSGIFVGGVLLLASVILVFTGLSVAIQKTDIIINDQGISRRIFGMAWRTIRWDNVKIIKSFHVVAAGFYPKQVNAYVIYPRVKKSSMLSVTGSIAFNNGFSDMNQLIELLNLYIRENNIKVEVQSKGTKTIATQLEK